jgi:ATP sulfurylase
MQFLEIDTYITKFKELARQAGYTAGNPETLHTFIKELTQLVMEDVLKPPHVMTYQEVKQKAIECMRSQVLLEQILKARQPRGCGFQGGAF